ncbi:hypothetical protein AQUCO_04400045v1 [Aquilegia coerulea]|uniref:Haloacid dehalogenase-like hydrolase domain-containing protein Sgpp n=1 Tax=Aquilegia coerulea TaxID=218851 RepID=A0A2G5CP06_AQUCA|nr:hypothetical protein AQUCO_04400045v1 [Aquilegia coerulea]
MRIFSRIHAIANSPKYSYSVHFLPLLPSLSSSPSYINIKTHLRYKINLCWGLSKMSVLSNSQLEEERSITSLAPLEAVLFDVDGTLSDSDPIHYDAFVEMLQEAGFNGGVPITEEFYVANIAGKHNEYLCETLFPDWDFEKGMKFLNDKEALFRRLAAGKIVPVNGLNRLRKWIEERGFKRAAVTNAPRPNAELMLSSLDLNDFFQDVIIGGECERAKPFPDPYLKGLEALSASPSHTLVFEDSPSGVKAGVAAGMPVVAVTFRNPEHLLRKAGATLLIKDYDDPKLWKALEELEKAAAGTQAAN